MADAKMNRLFNGNLAFQSVLDGREHESSAIARTLVEECISISLADLRKLFGRKEMLRAAQDAQPLRFQIHGNPFSANLVGEPHRLPNRNRRVSDREVVRLWLVCTCRRKVRKLFTHPKFPGSSILVMPACRKCLGLAYQSQNCGGNKWWKEAAVPLKRLLRRRERLLARKQSPKSQGQLEQVDQAIMILRRRVSPRATGRISDSDMEPIQSLRVKRPYRNISLIEAR